MHPGLFKRSKGFSLVEMLVALVFVSILLVGMLQISAVSLNSFATATEAMGANRTKRWAITQIEDDFQSMGYFYYHPYRVLPGYVSVDTSKQAALLILPDQSITYNTLDTATGALVSETVRFDEVQFLEDQVLPIKARLSSAPTVNSQITLTVLSGTLADVQAGDFVAVLDQFYEICKIASRDVTAGTVTLDVTDSAVQDPNDGSGTGASKGLQTLTHQSGVDVFFVRPLQVIRYTILALALDPGNTSSSIPCLVRDQGPYPTTGSRITWPAANATIPTGYLRTILAENVSGQPVSGTPTLPNQYALRVDISPDNGTTWCRNGAANWAAVAGNLNTWLSTYGRQGYKSVTDTSNPIWYRNIPALFKVDLSTRTPVQRSNPNSPQQRVYTYRSQTLLCQPRNFTNGL